MVSLLSSVPSASRTPVLVGLAGLVLWALAERWLYAVKLRQSKGLSRDKGSFPLLSLSWYGAVLFSLSDAILFRWSTIDPALSTVQFVGVPFVALGLIARVVARLTLGKEFSSVVQTTDSHKLVTVGIYGVIRHPQYAAGLLWSLALILISQSWIVTALGVVAISLAYADILIADKHELEKFGDDYKRYMRSVPRINFVVGIIRLLRRGEKTS